MEQRTYFILLFLFTSIQLSLGQMVQGQDTLVGNEWIRYNQEYYKFSVDQDGVYRISAAVLASSGLSGALAIGDNFRLYNMGRQVPLFVSNNGQFGANDYIEFYGRQNLGEMDQYLFLRPGKDMLHPDHSLYTDQNTYYLTNEGDDAPQRITNLINDLTNPPAVETYYLHREIISFTTGFNDPYYSTSNGGSVSYSSYMHGEGFCKAAEINSTTQIPALNRAPGGPDAFLHVRLTSTNYGVHSFVISLNNQVLDTIFARDIQIRDTTFSFPLNLLADDNQLSVTSLNISSRHSLVGIELTYARTAILGPASNAPIWIEGKPGNQHFVFEGFPHQGVQPLIYSHDGKNRMIAAIDGMNRVEFLLPESLSGSRLDLTDQIAGIRLISQLEQKEFTDYTDENTEYIVITHPALMEIGTGSEYIQYRSSAEGGSYRAKAYSILDLYDQFGYGIEKHPQAIRNFVEFFHRNWPAAKMVYIIGRGIEYNRSRYSGTGWEASFFVPTFGRPGSDQLLAATLWDLVARYPVGRLAVTRSDDIDMYLAKVREYDVAHIGDQTLESKSWIKNIIHIGGGMDAQEQDDFKSVLNSLGNEIAHSDFGAKVSFFHKQSTDIIGESQSKLVEKLLHDGSTIINYLGHSSTSTFEFNINDPTEWNNKGRYPIFSAMGCSAGQIHSTVLSLSDRYIFLRDEGAIAFISGSGSQYAAALSNWAFPWYDYIGGSGYEGTLGESILVGLRAIGNFVNPQFTGSNQYRFLLEQQTFQGDPALRFHPFPGPDYLIDRNSVSISPAILNTKLDSFSVQFSLVNIGRNLRQTVGYTIHIKAPDGHETELHKGQIESLTFGTAVNIQLPLSTGGKPGAFRLLITVDPDQLLAELPDPQAENNNQLIDNLGTIGIPIIVVDNIISAVYPSDFGIVSNGLPELVATSSNSFIKRQDIVLELDTTSLFNSPAKIREKFPGHSATLKWSPQFNYVPGQVYYWRVSTDSISPEQTYLWSKRSFLFKPGSPKGWNQSHYYQLTDNSLEQLVTDSTDRTFSFGRKNKNYRMLNRFHDINQGLVPYFFEDGKFIAKLAQTFRFSDVHGFVVAIDTATGRYFMNPPGGLYGSVGLAIPMEGFAYNLNVAESRQAMIDLIENKIPSGYYVFFYTYQHTGFEDYHPEMWAGDELTYGKSIFTTIEHQFPSSAIRSLATTGSLPYIILFQKDNGVIEEQIATTIDDVISISFDGGSFLPSGKFISVPAGPAAKWHSIEHHITSYNDTTGATILSAWALNKEQTDTLWISHQLESPELDISGINADSFPFIQLGLYTLDSAGFKPATIDYWRVLFDGYPEFVIQPDVGFEYIADTLQQGQQMSLSTYIENISDEDIDSLPVSLRIISKDNQTEEIEKIIPSINKHSSTEVRFQKNTDQMTGDYQVLMEINPKRTINELNYANNIGILPLTVIPDRLNPVLDVTFDGQHILDGDLVASKPVINIQLHDESPYLRLDDTSSFNLYLQYPSDPEPERLAFTENWVHFIQAPGTGKNVASVELTPELLEDGIYHLQVRAKDASGNLAGDNDYTISFEVINEESVSHLYNYPNPFSTSTRFVYTLTGDGSPPYYKIQIMSLSGKVVREITQQEIGPLIVGTHMTDFVWDGTDEQGGRLAAGTYLYRMIVKNDNLEDFKRYNTSRDDTFFTKGWGKLVILR